MFERKNLLSVAEGHVRSNRIPKAIETYLQHFNHNTHDLHVLNTVGDLYSSIGDKEKAREFFIQAATGYLQAHKQPQAILSYLKAFKTDPQDPDIALTLAELYVKSDLKPNAVKFVQEAAKVYLAMKDLNPDQIQKVRIITKLNQKLLDETSRDTEALINQAGLLRRLEKFDQAFALYMQVGALLVQEGKLERSLEVLSPLLQEEFADFALIELITDILMRLGKSSEALIFQRQFLEKDPTNTRNLKLLGNTLLSLGDHVGAEEVFRKLAAQDQNSLSEFLKFSYFLVSRNELDRAVDCIRELVPSSNYIQKTEMIYILKKILEKNPSHMEALKVLGDLYCQCSDVSQMLKTYHAIFDLYFKKGALDLASEMAKRLMDLNYRDRNFLSTYEKLVVEHLNDGAERLPGETGATVPEGGERKAVEDKTDLAFGLRVNWEKESTEAGNDLLANVDILCKYGHYETAIDVLTSQLATDPENAGLHERLKSVYIEHRLLTHAAKECVDLFRIYQRKGFNSKAEAMLKEGLRLDPSLSAKVLKPGSKDCAIGLSGDFETFTIPDVIQFIDNSGKSGILKIVAQNEEGKMYFNNGQVADAAVGDKMGIEAVYHLIRITKGNYEFEPRDVKFPVNIKLSTINLLLEGLRLLDEERAKKSNTEAPII